MAGSRLGLDAAMLATLAAPARPGGVAAPHRPRRSSARVSYRPGAVLTWWAPQRQLSGLSRPTLAYGGSSYFGFEEGNAAVHRRYPPEVSFPRQDL